MAASAQAIERLRQYLRELKPASRAMLVTELERGLVRGQEMPGAELVLQELRRVVRDSGRQSKRPGNLARLFFQPLEPFLVDDAADHRHCGRIARVSLEPIWQWISRDLMPGEVKAISDDVSQAVTDNDTDKAENLARDFQDRVIVRMREALQVADADPKAMRRLAGQVGTPRARQDIESILGALEARDTLAAINNELPGHIRNLESGPLQNIKILLDKQLRERPGVLLYALVLVMNRLAARWQLIRFAIDAAGSDIASRVGETPYAVAVTMVLAETERMVSELKSDLKSGGGIAVSALLKDIHDAARGVRTELDLSADSPWARQLAALRTDISNILKNEIESMPGRVRRLLRPRPASDIAPGSMLSRTDVEETAALIEFVDACRLYAGELAISEMTQRAYSELQQSLENGTQPLIDALRHAGEDERGFRKSQAEAAIRFCRLVFGPEHAAVIAKAVDVAEHSERKSA